VPASASNHDIYSLDFYNTNTGWLCGAGGSINHSTDGGANWIAQNSGTSLNLNSIFFINSTLGWVAGGDREGIILKTTDEGTTWNTLYMSTQPLRRIRFSSPDSGWAAGDSGIVLFTSDSGQNWQKQNTGNANNFYSVFFTSNKTGWLVGGYGLIYKTSNGGEPIGIIGNQESLPNQYFLFQNYPNPFNPATEIKYDLPRAANVTIKIYNTLGEEVKTLVSNEFKNAGSYSITFDGSALASGVYFYTITAGEFRDSKKMVLIK
jgi:photosystem II stability/assembly factor-like uncharacterized protein